MSSSFTPGSKPSSKVVPVMKLPPLPTSTSKENLEQRPNQHLPASKEPRLNSIKPSITSTSSSLLSTSTLFTSSHAPRRVLRYGETMESLFGLTATSDEHHWTLAKRLVDTNDNAADNVSMWTQVLQFLQQQVQQGTSTGSDLLRLYRRATARFPLDAASSSTSSSSSCNPQVLDLYLGYAQAQREFGSLSDARFTLHNLLVTTRHADARIYLCQADLEIAANNVTAAKQAVQLGIQHQAVPLDDLQRAFQALEEREEETAVKKTSTLTAPPPGTSATKMTSTSAALPLDNAESGTLPGTKRKLEQDASPKRRKTEESIAEEPSIDEQSNSNNNMSLCTEDDSQQSLSLSTTNHSLNTTNQSMESHASNVFAENKKYSIRFQLVPPLRAPPGTVNPTTQVRAEATTTTTTAAVFQQPPSTTNTKDATLPKHESVTENGRVLASKTSLMVPELPDKQGPKEVTTHTETTNAKPNVERTTTATRTVALRALGNDQLEAPKSAMKKSFVPDLPNRTKEVTNHTLQNSATKPSAESRTTAKPGSTGTEGPTKPGTTPLRQSTLHSARVSTLLVDGAVTNTATKAQRPPLISSSKKKTPRLWRVGLSGKARRADPEEQTLDSEESECETLDSATRKAGSSSTSRRNKPKITKMDLSYMMEWDPNKRQQSSSANTTSASKNGAKPNPSKLEKIDEAPPSLSSSTGSGATANGSTASHHSSVSNHSRKSLPTNEGTMSTDVVKGPPTTPWSGTPQQLQSASSEAAAIIAQSNRDFLPLVSETNMLRINGVPYAKLGVIGKGGSCKVYRALSKECNVLAIKKVKLDGVSKKAIDGYANEIALLKRLRGNPAIIQMFDSEVDLERKAIYVAMEAGEVDLNHVLQEQAKQSDRSGTQGRCHFNMNFIRLTWQQMLSAVHCIHEERIIHGDLKPANFLFVRGALKLIDFGIAKAIQTDDTTNIYRESQIGTLNYMSPESIMDTGSGENGARMKIGRASDIWSLGCILYQMVYGRTPFAELHMIQKLQAIIDPNHEINFPDTADDGAIDAIKQCLRFAPEERPPIVGPGGLLNEHRFLNSRVIKTRHGRITSS